MNGRSAKAAWLPPTKGLRDWRTQMSERDRALFEALAGDLLADLGYERTIDRIPADVEAAAERCRGWWAENMRSRRTDESVRRDRAPRTSDRRNPYVFIVGCPRSGTTMLKRIVDAHSEIAITPETHWIPRFYRKRTGITPDGLVTPEFLPRLLEYHKFANLKIDRDEVERLVAQPGPHPYEEVVSGILDLFGARKGKTLVGDKTPGYVQYIPLLHDLWPAARFVHLVRDGRDVCLSMLDWDRAPRTAGRYATWDEDPVVTTALWWERFVRLGRESARVLAGQYHEIRYEMLVAEPEQTCADLCRFLAVAPEEAMIRFHEGRTRTDPAMSPKRAWRPITAGIRDWRTQMSEDQVERFEATAGDLLTELGYERACPEPREAYLVHAARLRDQFTKDPHFKERSLPARWALS